MTPEEFNKLLETINGLSVEEKETVCRYSFTGSQDLADELMDKVKDPNLTE